MNRAEAEQLVSRPECTAAEAQSGFAQATQHHPHVASTAAAVPQMPRFRFENYTTANGLPANHVYAVLVDGDRIWAGTDNGLGLYEDGRWKMESILQRQHVGYDRLYIQPS